ncbi:MAG: primosomal protein N' [Planctomycetota bacterium]
MSAFADQTSLFGPDPAGSRFDPSRAVGFVRVAVERGYDRGTSDAALTYALTESDNHAENHADIRPGDLVEVPLGRGNTPTRGIVIDAGGPELLGDVQARAVKPITRLLGSPLTPELVDLARWMSRYYLCPLGMTLGSMIPAAVKQDIGRRRKTVLHAARPLHDPAEDAELTPTARRAWLALGALADPVLPATARDIADAIGERSVAAVNRLVKAGLLSPAPATFVRAREDDADSVFDLAEAPKPTPDQAGAVAAVEATLGAFHRHLLFGVTGSGKTEVYLRLLRAVLDRGQSAVMLVPEIALTPQTAGRVQSRLGRDAVAVLHSGLTAAQRNRAWSRVIEGRCRVVVGARSAVFAPVTDLGLVIVDEEHDGSYKQDQLPRYHARDVAVTRAHRAGCPVVLGSATPSLESWRLARTEGSSLLELPSRVGNARLPEVRVVDMVRESAQAAVGNRPSDPLIGPTLEHALRATLTEGGQAVMLLNRRGYAGVLACPSSGCDYRAACDHCDANLVLHTLAGDATDRPVGGYVRCHHCQAEQRVPRDCPICGKRLRRLGHGTQRAERVLEAITADLDDPHRLEVGRTLARVDADTMRSARDYAETLARFARGELRVLLGTQMIAKGLDVPGVRLVGVISADTALTLPDFRASERTYQLVSQVAGRAGRGEHPGRVIVQTYEPDAEAIRLASRHDYTGFADAELRLRDSVKLPPVWRMARVVCRDRDERRAEGACSAIADAARPILTELGGTLDGPMRCPIARIADHWRYAAELRAPTADAIQRTLRALRDRGLVKADASTAVDVDPVSLM